MPLIAADIFLMTCISLAHVCKIIPHVCYKYFGMHMEFRALCSNSSVHRMEVTTPDLQQGKILQNKTNLKCLFKTS